MAAVRGRRRSSRQSRPLGSHPWYHVVAMQVGVRTLKAHLSEYLTRVRAGEEVIVTDRGLPVARITPLPSQRPLPKKLQELIAAGRAVDKGPMRYFPEPIQMTPGDKTSTDFIREQRR